MDVHRASFAFDVAMDSTDPNSPDYVSQEKCYEIMGGRMVEHLKQGFNTCLFCYGQTGTGKTTTIMGSVRQNHLDDPSVPLELDKWKDPWAECGVGEVEALQEEHRLQLEELRDRNRKREMEIHEAAQEQLRRLQEELDAAKAELQRRNDQPEVEALPLGHLPPPVSNGRGTPGQAPSLVARCLELGKANKALLESLCVEQREGLDS